MNRGEILVKRVAPGLFVATAAFVYTRYESRANATATFMGWGRDEAEAKDEVVRIASEFIVSLSDEPLWARVK